MSDEGRMSGAGRCTRCGGELRLQRRPVRAHFGGREVRMEVESDVCTGCGELHYRAPGRASGGGGPPPAGGERGEPRG